jgi:hypothetical protein
MFEASRASRVNSRPSFVRASALNAGAEGRPRSEKRKKVGAIL